MLLILTTVIEIRTTTSNSSFSWAMGYLQVCCNNSFFSFRATNHVLRLILNTGRALKHLIKDLARVESSVVVPEVYANQLWWFGRSTSRYVSIAAHSI